MGRFTRGLACVLAAATLVTAPASAAPKGQAISPERQRALDLFEQSAQSYRAGRFQEAVDLLVEARRHAREPVLLYNLARAYEALGKPTEAADAYAQYLDEEPSTQDRGAIEGRIATLRAQASDLAAARAEDKPSEPTPPAPQTRESPSPPPEGSDVVPWIVTGAGIAAVGTGLAFGLVAESRHDDAVAEPTQRGSADLQSDAEGWARASTITVAAGAIIVAVGVSWLVLRVASGPGAGAARRPGVGWTF